MEVALIGLIGILVGIMIDFFKTKWNLAQARRTEYHKYLVGLMQQLADAYAKYERYLNTKEENDEEHAQIIGQAIAACLMAGDTYGLPFYSKWKWFKLLHPVVGFHKSDFEKTLSISHNDGETEDELRARELKYSKNLTFIAIRRLTRNRVGEDNTTASWPEVKVFGKYKTRNRNALIVAMQRLAELIVAFK